MDRSASDRRADDLWAFSLSVYGEESVRQTCLDLQDRCDADINVLLLCCWVSTCGAEPLLPGDVRKLLAAARPLRNGVIKPLRAVRRYVKELAGKDSRIPEREAVALRKAVGECELSGERLEQMLLVSALNWSRGAEDSPDDVRAAELAKQNLLTYVAEAKLPFDDRDRALLDTLVAAAFPWPATLPSPTAG